MIDPIHEPNLITEIKDISKRVTALERATTRSQQPQVMPVAPILSPVGNDGYLGTTLSTEQHAYRVDGNVTAYYLDYDFTLSDYLGTTATLMEWAIYAFKGGRGGYPADALTVDSGSQAGGNLQVFPPTGIGTYFDLRTVAGLELELGDSIRFDIRIRRTGGTVLAVRLNKPLALRTAASIWT